MYESNDRDKRRRRKERRQESTGPLYCPLGESIESSAVAASSAQNPHTDASPYGDDKRWLVERLLEMGAEKPSAYLDAKGVWTCRDGKRKLGAINKEALAARDLDMVSRMFYLRSAVVLRILRAPIPLLWDLGMLDPQIRRRLTLAMLQGELDIKNRQVSAFAYHKAKEYAKEFEANSKKLKDVGGAFLSTLSKATVDKYKSWMRTQSWKTAPPWAKAIGFEVKADCLKFEVIEGKAKKTKKPVKRILVKCSVLGMHNGRRQDQPLLEVRPGGKKDPGKDRSSWATVHKIMKGEYPHGSARILHDGRMWLMRLSYKIPPPKRADGPHVLVVRRGMNRFIFTTTNTGVDIRVASATGESLIAVKNQMAARRGRARRHLARQGTGARGHGKKRFYRVYTKLSDYESRFVKTWCQQQAASIIKAANANKCSLILVESFETNSLPRQAENPRLEKLLRRFPFSQLRDSILHAAKTAGIETQVVSCKNNWCPICRKETDVAPNGWETCVCGIAAWTDTMSVWRLLEKAEVPNDFKKRAAEEVHILELAISHKEDREQKVREANAGICGSGSPRKNKPRRVRGGAQSVPV